MLKTAAKILSALEVFILCFCMTGVLVLIFYEVIARNVRSIPFFAGTEELALILALWLYYLGAAHASKDDVQIKVNLIQAIPISAFAKRCIDAFANAATFAVCGAASYYVLSYVVYAHTQKMTIAPWGWPYTVITASLAIGLLLMTFFSLARTVNGIRAIWWTEQSP